MKRNARSLEGFMPFLRKELREAWRTGRLPVVALVFFAFGLISPLTAKYLPDILQGAAGSVKIIIPTPQASDAVDQFLKNVAGNGIFVAILLAMGMVAREKERGTAAFVLAKPITRQAFLAAKLVALLVTLGAGVAVAATADYAYTALLFKPLPLAGFIGCAALTLLLLLVYGAVTFLASAALPSALGAAGAGVAFFVVFAALSAQPDIAHYMPGGLTAPARALALGLAPQHLVAALAGSGVIVAAALVLAWAAFRRQEFTSAV
ncbi:MAG TPA: ABC transporter permease [Ktedonobacterales bacterium]